ncbi:MAG: 2-dehydropantoate 2-reductase N-terminal domain-containing protein, partial [Acidobacteriota bacterium]
MPDQLRHAILGAGGVGGLIGACLARSGAPVTMVVRAAALAKYPQQLQLESPFGNFTVPVTASAGVPACDVLWLTVKATQLEESLAAVKNPDAVGVIVPLLNGIDHLAFLRSRYGNERVIPATIAVESERVAPGHM